MGVSVAMVTRLHSYSIIHKILLAQGSYVQNMNFIGPQIAELRICVSVAMVTRFTKQQNDTQSRICILFIILQNYIRLYVVNKLINIQLVNYRKKIMQEK